MKAVNQTQRIMTLAGIVKKASALNDKAVCQVYLITYSKAAGAAEVFNSRIIRTSCSEIF